jgi:hypothetical protein
MSSGGFIFFKNLLFLITAVILLIDSAYAEEKKGFRIEPSLNIYYDDNITYERNAHNKKSDIILEPDIYAAYRTRHSVFNTKIFGAITGELYTDHNTYSYGIYSIGITQGLPYKISTTLRYTLTPDVCLEEDTAGTSCTESTDYHTASLSLDKEFAKGLSAGVSGKYGIKNYETRYDYKDTSVYGSSADAAYRITKFFKIGVGYRYERGIADGENDARYNNDISYFQHIVYIRPTFNITPDLSFSFRYLFRDKEYATNLRQDRDHYDRKDITHKFQVKAGYWILKDLELTVSYERAQKDSTIDYFDYHQNLFMFGGRYLFKF